MKIVVSTSILFLSILFISCHYPVTLHVSSQSVYGYYIDSLNYEMNGSLDIQVKIDEHQIVNQEFDVGTGHNWKTFKLDLNSGIHKISVMSEKAEAELDTVITVKKPIWLILTYIGRNQFRLEISTSPVAFL